MREDGVDDRAEFAGRQKRAIRNRDVSQVSLEKSSWHEVC